MTWLRDRPASWYVLADPGHAWKYGVSVRLAAQKDTLIEAGKDTALAIYDRDVAMAVRDKLAAVASFDQLTSADLKASCQPVRPRRRSARGRPGGRPSGAAPQSTVRDLQASMTPQDWIRRRPPFGPRRWLGNGHAMTVFTWARRREFPDLPAAEPRLFRTAPDTQVLAHCFWQPSRATAPTVLVLHGLEGSSEAHYMRGLAAKAWRRGWNAVLLNQRNCGGTDHLTPTLYHSGLTLDPREVIRTLAREDGVQAVGVIGYSLGGNLAVKLSRRAGRSGPPSRRRRRGGEPDHRSRAVRACDRAPAEHPVSLQLRAEPQAPPAPEGAALAGPLRPAAPRLHLDHSPVRRGLHRPRARVPECRRLLSPGERAARHPSRRDSHA